MRVKYNMFLFQLDDEPNLYLGNGWKSPVPSMKKWLLFRVPITSPNITWFTPEGLTWLHMRIRYFWKFPEKPTEIGLVYHHGFSFQSFNVGGVFQPKKLITTDARCGAASRNRCLAGEVMYLPSFPESKKRFPPRVFPRREIPIPIGVGGWQPEVHQWTHQLEVSW